MTVHVYVEGPSDALALRALFRGLIQAKQEEGISIKFFPAKPGHNKGSLLKDTPRTAVDILRSKPNDYVVELPDLYPSEGAGNSYEAMRDHIMRRFNARLRECNVTDARVAERFHVFCLKHDLEVLVLAAHEELASSLNAKNLKVSWTTPVEDQNHDRPPKKVVEALFEAHGQEYEPVVDAPSILGAADYHTIATRCPQCFAPFVEFLTNLAAGA